MAETTSGFIERIFEQRRDMDATLEALDFGPAAPYNGAVTVCLVCGALVPIMNMDYARTHWTWHQALAAR